MTLTAGALSQVSVSSTQAVLSSAVATGGTGPYTYQWYRSTTSGFSPGSGNIIAGATSRSLTDTGLIPNTQYYYKVVVTDTGNSNVTDTSSQLAVATTVPVLSQNQFAQAPYLGMIDLRFDGNTIAVQIDPSQSTALYPGQAVKIYSSTATGVPSVVGCTADSDQVLGFINYDIKNQTFTAGQSAEVSMFANVMYLYATGAITRGAQVTLDVTTVGGVAVLSGSSGNRIVGWAIDGAAAGGTLIRVWIQTPSFAVA